MRLVARASFAALIVVCLCIASAQLWDDVSGAQPRYLGDFVGLTGSSTLPAVNQSFDDRLVAGR